MHFEFLVEGRSELTALSIMMHHILGEYRKPHTWNIHKHRGIGNLPDDLLAKPNPANQTLLYNLPSKLRAYAASKDDDLVVVVLVDLDDRKDCRAFKANLVRALEGCTYHIPCLFCIAIEELEAWYLGDEKAILEAYPDANVKLLHTYKQDSQCGTWELLCDAVYPELHRESMGKRSQSVLGKKVELAKRIAPHMNIEKNRSCSFQYFRDKIRQWR